MLLHYILGASKLFCTWLRVNQKFLLPYNSVFEVSKIIIVWNVTSQAVLLRFFFELLVNKAFLSACVCSETKVFLKDNYF